MSTEARRKSGTSGTRKDCSDDLHRDGEILESLLKMKRLAEDIAARCGEPREPLSVYSSLPFPMLIQPNGQRMPRWDQLTEWMKLQVAILAFSEWGRIFLTFTVHLNEDLVKKWISEGPDVARVRFRDRLRSYLNKSVGSREFLFSIEGMGKSKLPTRLHIHGAVVMRDHDKTKDIDAAIYKAAGQGLKGKAKAPKALRTEMFYGDIKWGNYLLKYGDIPDARLGKRRLGFSNSTISAGKSFWNLVTGRWSDEAAYQKLKASMAPPELYYGAGIRRKYKT